jgi:hypothetical protein
VYSEIEQPSEPGNTNAVDSAPANPAFAHPRSGKARTAILLWLLGVPIPLILLILLILLIRSCM